MAKRTFVDLFAGCGGLSLGLENAGFHPLLVNELSPDAMGTYLLNRQSINPLLQERYAIQDVKDLVLNEKLLRTIIRGFKRDYKIDTNKGELDLVAGGPPCQGYSGIGHRRSYSVDKKQLPSNHLFQDMAYVVNKLQPKAFLFENVKGLLSAKWSDGGSKGEIWAEILETFSQVGGRGYKIAWDVVYAKSYGVPQNRPRVLMVGLRTDVVNEKRLRNSIIADGFLPVGDGDYPDIEDLMSDLVDDNYVNGGLTNKYPKAAASNIQRELRLDPHSKRTRPKGASVTEHEYSKHSIDIVRKFEYMLANAGDIPPAMKTKKFAQRVLPRHWGESGPTVTATSLPDDYVHYCQPRILTVREWARLQTFPDWYQFRGKRTTGGLRRAGNPRLGQFDREVPKYTQIGNAVPVKLAQAVGRHLDWLLRG